MNTQDKYYDLANHITFAYFLQKDYANLSPEEFADRYMNAYEAVRKSLETKNPEPEVGCTII